MALMQQLTNQGRVVGGYLTDGIVTAAKSDLVIQRAFKRQKLTKEAVQVWEEIATEEGIAGAVGQAVSRAALPGRVGKAVGAGLGAAMHRGRTIRVEWADGQQSLIELPEKLFMVLSVLLADRRRASPPVPEVDAQAPVVAAGLSGQLMELASSVVRGRRNETTDLPQTAAQPDVTEQLMKLASLRDQGILTDDEFTAKKVDLLSRL